MAIDKRISQAIEEAVHEANQQEILTRRLCVWFEAIASGNDDASATDRHLEVLFQGIMVDRMDEEDDD